MNRSHPDFVPLSVHTDRETGVTYTSPFPVAVFGIQEQFLGVGRVVGEIDDNPLIEVQDCNSGDPYYVMGYESWWTCPVPDEIVEGISSGRLATHSVAAYRQAQDDYWKAVDIEDASFLDDNGINPELE